MSDDNKLGLPDLENGDQSLPMDSGVLAVDPDSQNRTAAELEAVFDVPVKVSAVLGRAQMDVGDLLKLGPGAVLELDRKVGEAIDIYVNNRLVARGEVVLVEDKLGVTMGRQEPENIGVGLRAHDPDLRATSEILICFGISPSAKNVSATCCWSAITLSVRGLMP